MPGVRNASQRRPWPARLLVTASAFLLALGSLALAAQQAVADGPTTFSNTTAINIPATGSANQVGPASPYPSEITVSGLAGQLSKVTVTFSGLTHSTLNDVDALVVAPGGQNLVVLSDVGDPATLAFAANATLTFDDSAAGTVPSGNVPTGSYRPTNVAYGTDSFPAPAPTPSTETTLAGAFSGADPNGTWKLFVVDDTTGDVGVMNGGWSLTLTTTSAAATTTLVTSSDASSTTGSPVTFTATVTAGGSPVTDGAVQFSTDGTSLGSPVALSGSGLATLTTSGLAEGSHLIRALYSGATGFLTSNGTVSQRVDNATTVTGSTFCNTGQLTVPSVGRATPYPSNIFVTGLTGTISKVTAQLKGLSHTAPIDLDVMLSGPAPASNLFLMSDSGGQNPASGVNLTFDDDAASPIGSPLTSGTFRPTRTADESVENMPAPAPAISGATTLSTFNGQTANGTWSLWVVDDATGDAGSISGGWCVTISTAAATSTDLTSSPKPATVGQSVTFTATVTSAGSPVTSGTVQFSDGASPLGSAVAVAPDGAATLTTSTLTAGTHTIKAAYSGTAAFQESSDTVDQVVSKTPSVTALTSSQNPADYGASVTLTATVTAGGAPAAGGTVQFEADGTPVGAAVPLAADSTATLTRGGLAPGSIEVTATYSGTADVAGSSGHLTQVVSAQPTVTVLTGPASAELGASVTFTAAVTAAGGAPLTSGTVVFGDGGTPISGSIAVDAGTGRATFATSALGFGTHALTASFSGVGSTYQPSVSAVLGHRTTLDWSAGGPYNVAEGGSLILAGTGSSLATYDWDLNGDGVYGDAAGLTPTLTWAQLEALGINDGPASIQVRLRATAGGVAAGSALAQLTVTNTPPTTVVTGNPSATAGTAFTVKVGANDPSSADLAATFTYAVDWGDGSPVERVSGPSDPPVTHTYAAAGTYAASFTATDKDGGMSAPTSVTVLAAAADDSDSDTDSDDSDDDSLASTGANSAGELALAGLLIVAGAVTAAAARGRHSRRV